MRLRDINLENQSDSEILAYAATWDFIVLSHDVNTMTAEAYARLAAAQSMKGLLLAHQGDSVAAIIEDLILIAVASEAADWDNRVCFLPL